MPIVFSSSSLSSVSEKVLWVDEYVSRADSGTLTPTSNSLGFKTYIPSSAKALLVLEPIEYLAAFRNQLAKSTCREPAPTPAPTKLRGDAKLEGESPVEKDHGMAEPVTMQPPTISVAKSDSNQTSDRSTPVPRKSASLHKNVITKLRPLPFQYVWSVYYDKSAPSSTSLTTKPTSATYTDRLTTLSSSVPDIAEFYKIFNNIPWSSVKPRDSVHIFRSGVQPLWEDPENIDGGSWTIKVRKQPPHRNQQQQDDDGDDRAKRVWEEICLMGCGGELQAALAESGCRDHVLGMSFSPKLYWVCVSIWLKKGGDKAREVLQKTVLERLSPELRPTGPGEYFYKKHNEHEGWEEAVRRKEE